MEKGRRILLAVAVMAAGLLPWIGGGAASAVTPPPDPATPLAPGPFPVHSIEYNLSPVTVARYPGYQVDFAGEITYPTDGSSSLPPPVASGGHPLIVINHGSHPPCYTPNGPPPTQRVWPCPAGQVPIPSYRGFDYLAQALAAQGFIVDAISSNALNATDTTSTLTAAANTPNPFADLTLQHLDTWRNVWTASAGAGPPDTNATPANLLDAVNFGQIGLLGHSNGGQTSLLVPLANAARPAAQRFTIGAIVAVGAPDPVDVQTTPPGTYTLNRIPYAVMAGYCDGNVPDEGGIRVYDRSRYLDPGDPTARYIIEVDGANHFWWDTIQLQNPQPSNIGLYPIKDDWLKFTGDNPNDSHCGYSDPPNNQTLQPARLTDAQQRQVLSTYALGFFRLYLRGETDLTPWFTTGDVNTPASVGPAQVRVSNQPGAADRLVVNRFDAAYPGDALGGTVTTSGGFAAPPAICGDSNADPCVTTSPGNATVQPDEGAGAALDVRWSAPATLSDTFPGQDLSGLSQLQFRGAMNVTTAGQPDPAFTVTLTSGSGLAAEGAAVLVNPAVTTAFRRPGGDGPAAGFTGNPVPKAILQTVRVPLARFIAANPALDLTNVTAVTFEFGNTSGQESASGDLLLNDLMFATAGAGPPAVVPEARLAVLFPLSAAVLLAGYTAGARRRRRA